MTDKLNTVQAAAHLGLKPSYLHNMRFHKKGPKCSKAKGRVTYTVADLDAWNRGRLAKQDARADKYKAQAKALAAKASAMSRKASAMQATA